MYYIFSKEGSCLLSADSAVNEEDLQTRGEFAVESQKLYDGRYIKFTDGQIVSFMPDEVPPEVAPSEPMDANVLDLATAIIELSDRIDKIEGGQ